jgi:hypothetical protein
VGRDKPRHVSTSGRESRDVFFGESIMSEKKPVVARDLPTPGLCPVCGKASYSRNGTHPQCAAAKADSIARAARKAAGIETVKTPRKSWSKPCPKCKRQIPARRIVCDCGHTFAQAVPGGAVPIIHQVH